MGHQSLSKEFHQAVSDSHILGDTRLGLESVIF